MEYLIIIFLVFAIFHFIYESIIAPSIRLKLSFELFKVRDDVRFLKMQHGNKFDCKHFDYLQDTINILLKSLHNFDVVALTLAQNAIKNDKALLDHVQKRKMIFDDCKMPEAVSVRKETLDIAAKIILVNNGAWLVYLIPIGIVMMFYKSLSDSVKEVFSLSEGDFNKVSPDNHHFA